MNQKIKSKERMYLKDTVAAKIFTDESCREYLITFIAVCLEMDPEDVRKNLRILDPKISLNKNIKNQVVDTVVENDTSIINIEINYNARKESMIKNTRYVAHLMLRNLLPGKKYLESKEIYQINLNNFDMYNKNEFIYHTFTRDAKYNIFREGYAKIIDINLDFLYQIDYNTIKAMDENDLMWLVYIFVCEDKNHRKELYQENPLMKKVYKKMDDLTGEFDDILFYNKEEYESNVAFEMGEEKGKTETQLEIAKEMLKLNIPKDIILTTTKLSEKKLQALQQEINKKES